MRDDSEIAYRGYVIKRIDGERGATFEVFNDGRLEFRLDRFVDITTAKSRIDHKIATGDARGRD